MKLWEMDWWVSQDVIRFWEMDDKLFRLSSCSERWIDEFLRACHHRAVRTGLISVNSMPSGWWLDIKVIKGTCSLCEHWALRGGLTSVMEGNSEVSRGPCKLYLMTSTSDRWTDHAKAKHVGHDLRQFVKMSLCVRLWVFWGVDQNECHIKNSWTPPCASVEDFAWHPV